MNGVIVRLVFVLAVAIPAVAGNLYCRSHGIVPLELLKLGLRGQVVALARQATGQRPNFDDLQKAANYWYESRDEVNLADMDAALAEVLPKALEQASKVQDFQTWETAHQFEAYHDAGAILLAKSYTLLYHGRGEAAQPSVKLLAEKLPFAMLLRPDRTVNWARQSVRYHEHMCAMYAAIVGHKADTVVFPAERDEFDGPQQRLASQHMATLRLQESNYDAVEHWAEMAESQELRTCSGDRVIDLIYDAMKPWDGEAHSEAAWREVGDRIRWWQKQMPGSRHAKLAEACYYFHWAVHALAYQGSDGVDDFKERAQKGLRIAKSLPADCPSWYSANLMLMGLCRSDLRDVVKVFREGLEKHPGYTPLYSSLCIGLAYGGQEGREAAAGVIHQMVTDGHASEAARVLWTLCLTGEILDIKDALKEGDARAAITAALKTWPDSIELRSDMGYVAATLEEKDLARQTMANLAGRWNRVTWRGREELAMELCGQIGDTGNKQAKPPQKPGVIQ